MPEFRETLNYGLRAIAFVSIPATVIMVVLRVPIIQLLLQHGKFGSHSTNLVSGALVFYALGIFAWSAQALIARAFYSMNQTQVPMWTGTAITFVIFLPLSYILMKKMGYTGLPLATTIAVSIHAGMMLYFLRGKAGGIGAGRILRSVLKISTASAVMGAAMWFTLAHIPSAALAHLPFKVAAGLRVLLPMAAGGILFVVMVNILKLEESEAVWAMVKRRIMGRSATPTTE